MSLIRPGVKKVSTMTLLGAFRIATVYGSPANGVFPMTVWSPTTYPQYPQIALPKCHIKKIAVELNGDTEFFSGTINFILEKNDVEVWSSGALENTDLLQGSTNIQNQLYRWYDVNIFTSDEDFLVGFFECVSLIGRPEGIGINVWGTPLQ